jgi:hypothetical protein
VTADRFDEFLRSVSRSPSRRGAFRLLASSVLGSLLPLGAGSTTARKGGKGKNKKRKGKGKKKSKGKVTLCHDGQTIRVSQPAAKVLLKFGGRKGPCATPDPPPPEPTCSPACPAGMRCAGTQCVVGQGTCPPGGSTCLSNAGGGDCWLQAQEISDNCQCEISTEGETRCADGFAPDGSTGCGECGSSPECERLYPDIPGVFCVRVSGAANDCCSPGTRGVCMVPCPTPPPCGSPEDCPPGNLNLCEVATCTNGRCGRAFAPAGTLSAPGRQTAGDCRVMVCGGNGDDQSEPDNDDIPNATACTRAECLGGEPVHEPAGTPCNGGTGACDGAGNCVEP